MRPSGEENLSGSDILARESASVRLALWDCYFLSKIGLDLQGFLHIHIFWNILLFCYSRAPTPARGRYRKTLALGRAVLDLLLALLLLWRDSWLPPLRYAWEFFADPKTVVSHGFIAEFLLGDVHWAPAAAPLLLFMACLWLRRKVAWLGTAVLLLLVSASLTNMGDSLRNAGTQASQFYESEAKRVVPFRAPQARKPPFDIILFHICSLSWDDLKVAGSENHSLLSRFDHLFTQFNSVSSYSGPASLRLLRANCGQPSHKDLYKDWPKECVLFDRLRAMGYRTYTVMNHPGEARRMHEDLEKLARMDPPVDMRDIPVKLRNFDNEPILGDFEALKRWWDLRQNSRAERAALYYNTITLHGGTRAVGSEGRRDTRVIQYRRALDSLASDLDKFYALVEGSGRKALVVFVSEHGLHMRGTPMQAKDLRDIPLPSIVRVPLGLKWIGGGRPALAARPRTLAQPVSYLAIAHLLSSFIKNPPLGSGAGRTPELPSRIPKTNFFSENSQARVMRLGRDFFIHDKRGKWLRIDPRMLGETPESPPAPGPAGLPAGTSLLPDDPLKAYAAGLKAKARSAAVRFMPARGKFLPAVLRVETFRRPGKPYAIQITAKTTAPVARGDALWARFDLRSRGSLFSKARAEFVFERTGGDYEKSIVFPVEAGRIWRRIELPFLAATDLAAGEAAATFRLGFDPQVVEIRGMELIRYGRGVALKQLPMTRMGYAGRHPLSLWRWKAERRIERLRKSDLSVLVQDSSGKPVPGASVKIKMLRHAFGFGSAVNAHFLHWGPESPDRERYRSTFLRLFNKAVLDNALKWPHWERQREWSVKTIDWLRERGIGVRGHTLVWPGWTHLPGWLRGYERNPKALGDQVLAHIREEAKFFRGKLVEWDVLNEPYTNRDLMDILGAESMGEWFRAARDADPRALLYINDFGILSGSGSDTAHQDHYEETIRRLLSAGAPLDGIGMQGHFDWDLTPPARLLEILDRFAVLGKRIQVTEMDIDIGDEELQADYLRDSMTALFSHPSIDGIVLWGFWEGLSERRSAALFRRDWTLKPSGQTWIDLVFKRWWTDLEGRTNAQGRLQTRGFLGTYEVAASHAGKSETQRIALDKRAGAQVILTLRE